MYYFELTARGPDGTFMRFLIDTNIFIALEPGTASEIEPTARNAAELLRLFGEGNHQYYLHPKSRIDIRKDTDLDRRKVREIVFKKYQVLQDPPDISDEITKIIGSPEPESNDWVDAHLLASVHRDAVDCLVTNDYGCIKKAKKLGLAERILTLEDCVQYLRNLLDQFPPTPPRVQKMLAHGLNEADVIFDSFRADYPGFDDWLRKCKREQRTTWIVDGDDSDYAGLTIVKEEDITNFGLQGKILKICSFKVERRYKGLRFGELLLKTIFEYACSNGYEVAYVEVFEKYEDLVELFEDFGFEKHERRSEKGELVLVKPILGKFSGEDSELDDLEYHIKFGPAAFRLNSGAFVVPIKPEYHKLLFPDAELQLDFTAGGHPFGNSLRKAYICNAPISSLPPGSVLLFYRSTDDQSIRVVGIVEKTIRSSDPTIVARSVGRRTVYSFAEISNMCQREVLAILFRQSLILDNPISYQQMKDAGLVQAPPQTIASVPEGALSCLKTLLHQ